MRALPLNIGTIHFVGIGGIGMSGIAEVLCNLGYQVQGSDIGDNANVERLRKLGVDIAIGHHADNLKNAQVVVVSTAVTSENPEVAAARSRLIPVVRRAEMLGELMRLKWSIAVGGTHGKTTTTSLIASMLESASMDPTVINGGIINAWGSNARLGSGEWMVAEADESDGTFLKLPATIAVVTNIDPEHLEHYGSFDNLRDAFVQFVENIPFYGFAALCIDHAEVQAMIPRVSDRRLITYGFSPQADVRALNIKTDHMGVDFDVVINDRKTGDVHEINELRLPMVGDHNVLNSLAAVAIGREMGVGDEKIREGLTSFKGVKRRFTRVGEVYGVTIIDDYGHHPVEITAVLKAARQATDDKVIAVVQPHRYTRLRDLFEEFCTCFKNADVVIVTDVYEAGETLIEGYTRDDLVNGLMHHGQRVVMGLEHPDQLAALIHQHASAGDMVVCLGAGSISAMAHKLPDQLTVLGPMILSGEGET